MAGTKQDLLRGEKTVQSRRTAIEQATEIQNRKNLKNKILDSILLCYDLPSSSDADPKVPSTNDRSNFLESLKLFCPSDLDELVHERNIDSRCGYALCPVSIKPSYGATNDAWKIPSKRATSKGIFCSQACHNRNIFVQDQLSNEPVWLRDMAQKVKLKDSPSPITSNPVSNENPVATGETVERSSRVELSDMDVAIQEKLPTSVPQPPSLDQSNMIEGLPLRPSKEYKPRKT